MMKSAPPRKGFAYSDEGHNEGYRDATGVTFRPGLGVFVDVAFEWLDLPVRGDRPAQLLRIFQHEGLNHGDYMLQSEVIWTYNYDDLILISDFESVVPAAVVEQMKEDPKCVLLSNHGVAIDFESITSDVSVTRAAADRPSKDRNAASVLGRVDMTFTKHKVPKPKRVTAFSLWRANDKLSDLTAESLKELVTTPIGLQPVEADDVACHLAIEVEECGGPLLPRLGETMRLGACDAHLRRILRERHRAGWRADRQARLHHGIQRRPVRWRRYHHTGGVFDYASLHAYDETTAEYIAYSEEECPSSGKKHHQGFVYFSAQRGSIKGVAGQLGASLSRRRRPREI